MPRAAVLPGPAPAWDVSAPRNVGVQVDAPPAPTHGGGGSDARRKARAFPSRDCRRRKSVPGQQQGGRRWGRTGETYPTQGRASLLGSGGCQACPLPVWHLGLAPWKLGPVSEEAPIRLPWLSPGLPESGVFPSAHRSGNTCACGLLGPAWSVDPPTARAQQSPTRVYLTPPPRPRLAS